MEKLDTYLHIYLLEFIFPKCLLNTRQKYLATVSRFWNSSVSKIRYICILNIDNPNFIAKIGKVPQYCLKHNPWMHNTMSQLQHIASNIKYELQQKYDIYLDNIKDIEIFEELIYKYDLNLTIHKCNMNGQGCQVLTKNI